MAGKNLGKQYTIMEMPWTWFAVVAVVVILSGFITYGKDNALTVLPQNMVGAFAFMAVTGAILNEIGNRTPIVNKYLGGGPIVIIFGMAALNHFKILPAPTVKTVGNFTANFGFLDWYIAALITGSILGMNRKLLIQASLRYIPTLLAGVVAALGLAGIAGAVMGFGWKEAILYVATPIMGGGMGAGAVPLSKIYAASTGGDPGKMLSMMIPAVALGNAMAIIFAGLLNEVGKRWPRTTGNGQMLRTSDNSILSEEKRKPTDLMMMGIGLLLAGTFFVVGQFISLLIPGIHTFAWMILVVAVFKAAKVLPDKLEESAYQWFQFVVKNLTSVLLVGIGIRYTDLGDIIAAFSPTYLFLVFVTVIGAVLGTWFVGRPLGFFQVEASITAGLCMANMGGTGDVATLGAAHRMELMPFAQISSRIGGAIMLFLGGILISVLL